jgi:hypothetical protein
VHCFEDDPATYAARILMEDDLADLYRLRTSHRVARGVITKSWFLAGVFFLLALTAWWTIIPAAGFALLAAHFAGSTDWRAGRGRELDRDIAAATSRLRGLRAGGAW